MRYGPLKASPESGEPRGDEPGGDLLRGDKPPSAAAEPNHFYDEMADGLHALAQPLSIVQSAVEMLRLQNGTGPHSQRYLELSTRHIREACETFKAVQSLLSAEISDARLVQVDLREVLRPLIEVQNSKFEPCGVKLIEPLYTIRGMVSCDANRTEQAVNEICDAALSICAAGDQVEIRLEETPESVQVTIVNSGSGVKPLNARHRLGVALARANIRSQHGRCVERERPFSFSFTLPVR
jgi:signal transduction histidine kinase